MARVTLADLVRAHPKLFYPQTWYLDEEFMHCPMEEALPGLPDAVLCSGVVPDDSWLSPTAVQLADLYVRIPDAEVWERFLWCADLDQWGQRIFVGGVTQVSPRALQIHRHLHITKRWGIPRWNAALR